MTVSELIKLIPPQTFQDLAVETKVDEQVKKLSGEVMFKLILFSMLSSDKLSLRVMETYLQSARFKAFSGYDIVQGKYNSIRDRICTINSDYFEKLFQTIFSIYNKELKEEKALSKADSTFVGLASKLFLKGMKNGQGVFDKRFVKYSVNLKGSIPSSVKVYTDQSYVSEDRALAELINEADCLEGNIVVFDRGLRSRASFDKFSDDDKLFVGRAMKALKYTEGTPVKIKEKPVGSSVTITSDQISFLFVKLKKTQHQYRIIRATIDETKEELCFVTNIIHEDAHLIADWYKQRWEIEVFFKFLKQHLNVTHLVSRDTNGIKVMIYMTMILAILIIAYKKLNNMKGFKIPKLKFELELENEIIKEIVIMCGGDPLKAQHLFRSG